MQRIIQITIAGQLVSIEENAYLLLQDYLNALNRHFAGVMGREEIMQDIEARIAELFMIRLQSGAHAIDRLDALKVIETLGTPSALQEDHGGSPPPTDHHFPQTYTPPRSKPKRLYRNPKDRILGGVCSGVGNYFDIDPVIIRLIFIILFLTAGVGLLAYLLAWIIIPAAPSPEIMEEAKGGYVDDFESIKHNVAEEMEILKERGKEMSQELKEFFRRRK